MKLKILVGVLVFLIVLNLATIGTFVYMHLTRPKPRPGITALVPGGPRPATAPRLRHLPSERREALVGLLRDFHTETADLRTRTADFEGELFVLMRLDPVPAARVDSLLREISATRLEMSRIATQKLIDAKAVLPPEEQRLFFEAILEARQTHRHLDGPERGERPFDGHRRRDRPDR